jgi:hypothetical protein
MPTLSTQAIIAEMRKWVRAGGDEPWWMTCGSFKPGAPADWPCQTCGRDQDSHTVQAWADALEAAHQEKVACPNCGCDAKTAAELRAWKDE